MRSNSTSRWLRGTCLALVVTLVGGGAARADDPPAGPPADPAAKETLLERGMAALKVRMEAKLKEAELLEKAGKLEEALVAVRDVDRLYRETIDDLERLIGAVRGAAAQPRAGPSVILPIPPAKPPRAGDPWADGIGPEPGLISPVEPPPGGFSGRGSQPQNDAGARRADAVLGGLRWLAAHQSEDGGWEAAGFSAWCDGKPNTGVKPDGRGKAMYDAGVTGLALCAFLGAGYSNRGEHEFAKPVRKGLAYLKNVQDAEGCFGPRSTQHYIYNHAIAALAMVEAYGMTGSQVFQDPAQRALDFIALSRNPYFVWRYGVKPGDNDSSVTGWMMMTLKSAQLINADWRKRGRGAPLVVDEEAFDGVKAWFDKMTDPDYGRVGYISRGQGPARPQELVDQFPNDKSESMTAIGMLARIFLHEDPRKSAIIQKGNNLCMKLLPTWNRNDGSIDMYYWYYATLAIFQMGGVHWSKWERALDQAVVKNQRQDGEACGFKGSWDPVDPWGPDGGRIYSTAVMTMCCEVAGRYDRVFDTR